MQPYSLDTPTACCCHFSRVTARCDQIAIISLTFQPTVIQRACLRVLVFKHAMYVSTNSNPRHFSAGPRGQTHCVRYKQVHFWHQRFLVFHLMNCDNVIRYALCTRNIVVCPRPDRREYHQTRSLPRLRNTTRVNRFQTHTHALGPPVTSIILSLPRSGEESDDISLP